MIKIMKKYRIKKELIAFKMKLNNLDDRTHNIPNLKINKIKLFSKVIQIRNFYYNKIWLKNSFNYFLFNFIIYLF